MQNGIIKVGKYVIEPTTSVATLPSDEYNVINTKNGVVYISKKPLELFYQNKINSSTLLSNFIKFFC